MAFVPVPKDLTKVKTKVALNLTKRQLASAWAGLSGYRPTFSAAAASGMSRRRF